mgnify:CR=1 FL=1
MSTTTLGKRFGGGNRRFNPTNRSTVRSPYYNPRGSTRTRYLSLRKRTFRGPFRTGGFYGPQSRFRMEKKVIDTVSANYTLDTTPDITLLNGVSTGSDFTNRIGRRINVVAIQLRGWFNYAAAVSSQTPELARIMIIEDLQSNGVAPTVADIFNETTAPATSYMNLNNRERFKVHHDSIVHLPAWCSTTATQNTVALPTVDFYKRVNIPVIFEGTTAAVGSISSGAVYLVALSSKNSI